MATVLMDTSMLMLPVEANVRVFEELDRLLGHVEPLVPGAVLAELDALANGGGDEATAASVGLDLATDRCRTVHHDAAAADDAIVELATADGVDYVATTDRPLRDRVLDADVPVVSLRAQNKLAITRP
jgi:rRNA-processing protein FCF1